MTLEEQRKMLGADGDILQDCEGIGKDIMDFASTNKCRDDSFETWPSHADPLVFEITNVRLQDILEKLGANIQCRATYLIPDLQRPYVWNSKQVINLLDSLLKGWPFGQIVLAQTGESTPCFYPRSFYRTINRMGNGDGFTMSCPSDEATIVLDGQQRLQSLFLALAPNSGGLIQDQRQWMQEYHPAKAYDLNWGYCAPTAWLALNTENLASAFEVSKGKGICSLDYSARNMHPILEWVFKADNVHSHMLWRRQAGLPPFLVNPWTAERSNRHVLLGDLWLCQDEKDVENKAVKNRISEYALPALKAFAGRLNALKNLPIPALRIVSRKECCMDESVYNHMILSIFTRLNAAGETLTDEDITFAWIKRYWPQLESGLRADKALKDLMEYLTWKEIDLDSLTLVRLLSNFWTMIHREGKSLETEDFLDGRILSQVAEFWEITGYCYRRN